VSEINLGLYRTFLQPWVRAFANEGSAKAMRKLHPLRLQYEMFAATNPFLRALQSQADDVQRSRQQVSADNPFWQAQEQMADFIETSLDAYRDLRDHMFEATFHAVYGSPVLQAMVGLRASDRPVREKPGEDALRRGLVSQRIAELKRAIPQGGPREALLRALLYIRMPDGVVDERGFNFLRRMREEAGTGMPLADFKKAVREQFLMLLLDERACVDAIPRMIATDPKLAARLSASLHEVVGVVGVRSEQAKARLAEIEHLLEAGGVHEVSRQTRREKGQLGTVQALGGHVPSHKHS
jgi:hypothetical protein